MSITCRGIKKVDAKLDNRGASGHIRARINILAVGNRAGLPLNAALTFFIAVFRDSKPAHLR